jgi:RNA polymerase sigma-70 factor (ECF subfamily)
VNNLSDEELVTAARAAGQHDTRAFEALVRRHQSFVAANCRAITRSPNDVEDLAQEVFVKAFFGLQRFEERASFRGWLHRIKVNHCLNHLRKTKGVFMMDIEDPGIEGHAAVTTRTDAHASLQSAGDKERIFSVLEGMSDTLRLPLMLRDADGLSYEEIAAHLGIGLSAVKMRIKRGREEFRKHFAAFEVAGQHGQMAGIR